VLLYSLTNLIGVLAFLYPFWWPATLQTTDSAMAHATDAPLLTTLLVLLCLGVLLLEVQSQMVNTKTVALLGVLVAINATLRYAETIIPGPGGFSPIFLLIVLTGYVYGSRFGFLMGVLTLLVSALITGGVGPWLPYQMFTAGWVGISAPLCRPLIRWLRRLGGDEARVTLWVLAGFGGLWGLLYGAIMNLWFWPFAVGAVEQSWQPGIQLVETLRRYVLFYLVTSLLWDFLCLVGNMTLILIAGAPVLRVLQRFQQRFEFHYDAVAAPGAMTSETPAILVSGDA